MSNGKKVGVVGSGLVGKSWAMIFASQGYEVAILIHNKIILKSSYVVIKHHYSHHVTGIT